MSRYLYENEIEKMPNFLDSAVGLVLKTVQISGENVETDSEGYRIVKSGTVYPTNDGNAEGIVFTNTDVTHGSAAGSLMVGGRVLEERINISSTAKTALQGKGILFVGASEVSRTIITDLGFTASEGTFTVSDIAKASDDSELTLTAIGDDIDVDVATAALSGGVVTVTKVAEGSTQITCDVSDTSGFITKITVEIVIE